MPKLYEPCPLCRGTGTVPSDARLCVDPPELATELLLEGCPSCRGLKFVETGLSSGQVDRLRSDLVLLRDHAEAQQRTIYSLAKALTDHCGVPIGVLIKCHTPAAKS